VSGREIVEGMAESEGRLRTRRVRNLPLASLDNAQIPTIRATASSVANLEPDGFQIEWPNLAQGWIPYPTGRELARQLEARTEATDA
jgi:hypothetical protein